MSRHLISEQTRGVYVIAVTPFSPSGAIDYASVDRMLDFYTAQGVHGVTILGMMGEAQKLTADESLALTRHVLRRVAATLPTVVGVSGSSLEAMQGLSRLAMDEGAAGVMVAPVPGLRTDDQIYGYYGKVFDTLGTDYPSSTRTIRSQQVSICRSTCSCGSCRRLHSLSCSSMKTVRDSERSR